MFVYLFVCFAFHKIVRKLYNKYNIYDIYEEVFFKKKCFVFIDSQAFEIIHEIVKKN